ncbi:unnamed protein product [Lymnaea stagnalis]|uniref:Metalloendopeptidase n=1 Tax=Lymnaea stagnalis TaxID=6523 RepID=A0AAV2I828_LYMST
MWFKLTCVLAFSFLISSSNGISLGEDAAVGNISEEVLIKSEEVIQPEPPSEPDNSPGAPLNNSRESGHESDELLEDKENWIVRGEFSRHKRGATITVVESAHARSRRAAHNNAKKWGYKIPIVILSSFASRGEYYVILMKRALRYISDRLCVTFIDETTNFDRTNPNWFTQHGYPWDSYLAVGDDGGCSSSGGPGKGPVNILPCADLVINVHEFLHSLGGAHSQQGYLSTRYLTPNPGDVQEVLRSTYVPYSPSDDFLNWYFDPQSFLMYGPKTWTSNGLETYTPITDDFFSTAYGSSSDDVVFSELSSIMKCVETFCNNATVDCGLGYYTRVKGVCRCVCPDDRDVDTNCKTLKNGPSTYVSWPKTPLIVFSGRSNNTCPAEFDQTPGWYSFTGKYAASQSPVPSVPFPSSGKTTYVPVCTKNTPTGSDIDWESWPPGGQYCLFKTPGVPCGGAFVEAVLDYVSMETVRYNGSIGETTINGANVTQKYCCRYQESSTLPIELPNAEPFRILSRYNCPVIKGLKALKSQITWWTGINMASGAVPGPWWLYGSCILTSLCSYQPPVYGCNQEVTLDASKKSVTITTPGFPVREPNRRCFYSFKVPPKSKVRITFNVVDLSTVWDDTLLYKRFHQWQDPNKIDSSNYPYQIISDYEYMSLEYWSGPDVTSKKGVQFTADVILPEDFCYDASQNGADYWGQLAITETNEPCLNWADTVECADFPGNDVFLFESANQCRNPLGRQAQPWCYTYKNGTSCTKKHCDACNWFQPKDVVTTCAAAIAQDPTFCSSAVQRNACFKSCNFAVPPVTRATCSTPTAPPDGTLVYDVKSSYKEGERVKVKCATSNDPALDIVCTKSGWTGLKSACSGKCEDRYEDCQKWMSANPRFCNNKATKDTAQMVCFKSCGKCSINATCSAPSIPNVTCTSLAKTINPGEAMTFECGTGYYYVSGDKVRACSTAGNLLGSDLVCQASPTLVELNLNGVRKRLETLKAKVAYIMDRPEYRIPFSGTITKWYYYVKTSGLLSFFVFRNKNNIYTYVGSNTIYQSQPGYKWSFNVPAADQIAVQANDIIGVYSNATNVLYVSDCNDAVQKISVVPTITSNLVTDYQTKPVDGSYCLMPSLGAQVNPGGYYLIMS